MDSGVKNEVEAGELTGISLGMGLRADRGGPHGQHPDELQQQDGHRLDDEPERAETNHQQLAVGGAITGGIYSGGAMTGITVQGEVPELLTGSAANGLTFDFLPGVLGGEGNPRNRARGG